MVAGEDRAGSSEETPSFPSGCSNHGCYRASGGPTAVRILFGDPAHLCLQCAENFDQQRVCQHCDQIYSDQEPPLSTWIPCYACRRFVHRQCELKSGTSHGALIQGPGTFKCRACRERPAFSSGGAFKRLVASRQDTGSSEVAAKGIDIIASSAAALDDDTESDHTNEGAADRDESLDFSSLILKAAEHVSSLNLQSSPTFSPSSQDSTNTMTIFATAAAESLSLSNDGPNGSNASCSGDGSSQDETDSKIKRRRPKAIRTERAAAIAASYASLPNMRKTILNTDDTREGGEQSVIEYDWAQCDNPRCLKWRRLPKDVPLDDLKGKWTCKLNRWDLERSSCEVEEEELMPGETLPDMKPGDGDYDVQKNEFYSQLKAFLKEISCPMLRNPTLGGKDLDLYHLYREVTQRGGFDTVVAIEGTWARIFRTLPNYSPTVTDASYRLKRYYQEFLQSFEQRMFFRKDMRDITVQKFASRRSKKSRTSDNNAENSPAISAVMGTPTSKNNVVAYNIPPLLNLNSPSPQCASCKRPEQQLFPCEATGTGSIRVCSASTAGLLSHDRYLLCRSCITAYSHSRNPMALSIMSNPRLSTSGNVYPSGAFSPHVNFMPMPNISTVNKMKTGGGGKFYQSLPVHFPSPLP